MSGRPTVAVLFGGRSSEHGVSCVTAGGVLGALDRERWDVIAVGITRDGRWTLQSDDPARWRIVDGRMPEVDDDGPTVLLPRRVGESAWRIERDGRVEPLADVTVAFPLLHGPGGAGVLASAIGMDKQHMKASFRAAGLPVTPDVTLAPGASVAEHRSEIEALGLPVFVKPARAGSSMGISRVDSWDALEAAVADAV